MALVNGCSSDNSMSGTGGAGGSAGTTGTAGTSGASGTTGTAGTTGAAGAGGTTGAAGTSGGGGASGACPSSLPAAGSCVVGLEGRLCSYGDAPRSECRDRARCTGGQWSIQRSQCTPASPAAQCPAQPPVGTVACTTPNRDCYFTTGAECLCLGTASSSWVCNPAPTPGSNCPSVPPNAGTPCTTTASCSYPCGPLSMNSVTASCGQAGVWQWTEVPCSPPGG